MDLLANELSIHGQFHDTMSFREAFARLMAIRAVAQRFDLEVHCHSMLLDVKVMPNVSMRQALQRLSDDERRSAMRWLTDRGPFWNVYRCHGSDDYLECRGEVVTDSAIGEAAYRTLRDMNCALVSFTPSDWDCSSIEAIWRRGSGFDDRTVALENWRDAAALEKRMQSMWPIRSWDDLRRISANRFVSLTFADNCFNPLLGRPFAKSAAERIIVLFDLLNRLVCAVDTDGRRTSDGHRIYQDYFTGDQGLFSDSSTSEKSDFRHALTFPHPGNPEESLFCTWHGKVRHPPLRIHFSWPIRFGKPVYVVYAGPKITKR